MNRKAILIFNNGGPSNYLPGVEIDKSNYLKFLKSAEGGAWEDSEIKVYDNSCDKELLLAYINFIRLTEPIGYWLIIFSGHGYVNAQNETILELSPGKECSIQEIKKSTDNTRRLLIVDSCRLVIHSISESLKRERELFSDMTPGALYRERCRDLYMDQLEKVYSPSFNVAYAAEYNQCAKDDDTTGGYYSGELLNAASSLISDRKSSYHYYDYVASFMDVHKMAQKAVIVKSNASQTPATDGYWLDTIPFVVIPRG